MLVFGSDKDGNIKYYFIENPQEQDKEEIKKLL